MIRVFIPVCLTIIALTACAQTAGRQEILLNDVHSQLNPVRVDSIHYPRTTEDVRALVRQAAKENKSISISGGKHAMGGQQFGEGTLHISMLQMNDVLSFDREAGIVTVEAGITWPVLVDYLLKTQEGEWPQWGIKQKQTGADDLTVGGALSANAHSRGVRYKPIIEDVTAFTLVDAEGNIRRVSRDQDAELFSLVIGGYGLFGVITTVDLQLTPRQKLERRVEVIPVADLPARARQRIEEGALYGDFQYKTDGNAGDFMRKGVLATYHPVDPATPVPEGQKHLTEETWKELTALAHTDKDRAFELYSRYYLNTDGQIYWSDTHQMSYYFKDYHDFVNEAMPERPAGSLMITEVYVPREEMTAFIDEIARKAKEDRFDIVYGTLRLIEKDDESFLAWAKEDYACIIFNLRVDHDPAGIAKAEKDFQTIIDTALSFGGSYFLTYHRWARRDQVLAAYPQFPEFLALKRKYDPRERFQSEWYRHYRKMFAEDPQ